MQKTYDVALCWGDVFRGGKSRQTFIKDENSKRVAGSDHHVDSQVELKAVDQKRLKNNKTTSFARSLSNTNAVIL